METRICFIECSGNSGQLNAEKPAQISGGQLNGLVSCSEWTGVHLATLLEKAGIVPGAQWVQAEGSDVYSASHTGQSVSGPNAKKAKLVTCAKKQAERTSMSLELFENVG